MRKTNRMIGFIVGALTFTASHMIIVPMGQLRVDEGKRVTAHVRRFLTARERA